MPSVSVVNASQPASSDVLFAVADMVQPLMSSEGSALHPSKARLNVVTRAVFHPDIPVMVVSLVSYPNKPSILVAREVSKPEPSKLCKFEYQEPAVSKEPNAWNMFVG